MLKVTCKFFSLKFRVRLDLVRFRFLYEEREKAANVMCPKTNVIKLYSQTVNLLTEVNYF